MLSRCWDSATREIKPKMPLHSSKHYGTIAISQFWFQQVNLALSANLSKWLYVLLALISFFLIFFNDSWRQIISGYAGPIFAIFSPNESVLDSNNRSGLLFLISQGTLPWQPILWKMANSPLSSLWHSETKWDITTSMCTLTAQWCLYIMRKFSDIRSSDCHVVSV